MPISISKLPEVTNVKDNSFMLITQDGTTKRTMCDQFVTEEEARLDEFSPTVIISKSMSKTGEGDNIDYSSSVYDAPMKDVILKGKTLVNCIQEPSSQDVVLPYEFEDGQYVTINDTKESGALGIELKGQTLVNLSNAEQEIVTTSQVVYDSIMMLKPNTKYTIMYEIKSSNELTPISVSSMFRIDNVRSDGVLNNVLYGHSEKITTSYTFFKKIITSRDTTAGMKIHIRNAFTDNGLSENTLFVKNLIVLEGDYTDKDIPYFEGMTSCKMPILHTTGKNLCGAMESGSLTQIEGEPASHTSRIRTVDYIPIDGSYWISTETSTVLGLRYYDINKNCIGYPTVNTSTSPINVTNIPSGAKYLKFTVVDVTDVNYKIYLTKEQHTIGEYEPYKTSILSLPEEVVLRSLPNGVCDTFNTRTGEYVQRIGEITLDENTRHTFNNNNSDNVNVFYFDNIAPNKKFTGYAQESQRLIQCDSLKTGLNFNRWDSTESEYSLANSAAGFWIFVPKSIPQSWLAQNPVVVQYQLENPIVTKINLPSTLKSWNTITHIYSEIPENTLYPTLSHSNPSYPVILKPSTKYSIVANSYSNDHTNSAINFNLGGSTASTTVGNRVTTITTPSTLSNELLTMSGRGNKLNNVMVIEGDVAGDEPYFEGICDCKTPILSNVGKNLWDIDKLSDAVCTNKTNDSFVLKSWASTVLTNQQIREILKPNTKYTMRAKFRLLKGSSLPSYSQAIQFLLYAPNETSTNVSFFLSGSTHTIGEEYEVTNTFTTPSDFTTKILLGYSKRYANDSTWELGEVEFTDVQLEEMSQATEYEPHKSNTTTFDQKDGKTIVLRSLPDGTCDTLNVETGEYVQRIGANFVSGEVIESINDWGNDNNKRYCYIRISKKDLIAPNRKNNGANYKNLICDKLPTTNSITVNGSFSITHNGATSLIFCFAKDYTTCDEQVAEVKRWAKSNGGFTIQYELETPIVRKVDLSGFPYAYKDGHVILSSGSVEPSLTPSIEYKVATNRGSQITQNTKSVMRQSILLDDIEEKINKILEATARDNIALLKLKNK